MTCPIKRTGLTTQRTTRTTSFVDQAVVRWLRAAHGGPGAGRWGALAPSAGPASPPGSPGRPGQCRQHLAERGVDLELGERVAAGRALVDDRDRDPRLPGPVHEPQPGHHRQRGPEHEQTG